MQYAHLSACLCGGCEDGIAELLLRDHLRAGEGEENASWSYSLQRLGVEPGVALQRVVQGGTMLGKGGRIEDDEVVGELLPVHKLEGILAESFVTGIAREVERHIASGELDGLQRAVDRVHQRRSSPHGVERESSCVAEHIQHAAPAGIMLEQRAVVALVDEESRLLTFLPVDQEVKAVLHRGVFVAPAHDESVLWFHEG